MPYSHWRRRYGNNTRVLHIPSRCHRRASGPRHRLQKRKINMFEVCLSDRVEPRHQTESTPGKPKTPATGPNQLSVLGEKTFSPPSASEMKGTSTQQGRKSGDPAHPVEAPPLPEHQQATTSPPSPDREEGEVTPSDAYIPDSIARALLDALQEKRTGNQLPATMVSRARVRASHLQQRLVTGREPTETTPQATLDIITVGQEPADSTTLTDKVSTVSHTLDVQQSTHVPAQLYIIRSLNPTACAETTGGSLYTAIANSGNTCPHAISCRDTDLANLNIKRVLSEYLLTIYLSNLFSEEYMMMKHRQS